ncbi:hypothetical protein GCM10007425_09460 [Lysinibacillus alkalisoli]|uniref:Helicase DnaB n=1 Tax=Lysinibacillus alkalisoli TaxID=1911548 RepID=A0A917G155_9BACI|nr:DnaD domain protein [Lysinibacillus alkalisoli]GGG17175.1 hypothetical protein GCM10007425_09460 [Lysinibacillus alkalisoli]
MSLLPKELHQNDYFKVDMPDYLSTNERQLLTLLYQPIVGAQALSLYFTLWAEGEANHDRASTHFYLMQMLNTSLQNIWQARISLEAIGLLRTFRKDDDDDVLLIYELERPVPVRRFLADPLLSMLLYSKVGEHNYRNLRQRFLRKITDRSNCNEVTRSFTDVYQPINVTLPQDVQTVPALTGAVDYPFKHYQFDYRLFQRGLSEQFVPAKALTAEVREWIMKLAFLYSFDELQMQRVVHAAIDASHRIPLQRLKEEARALYKLHVSVTPPQLKPVFTRATNTATETKPKTKEQRHILYLEQTSPIENLQRLHKGSQPSQESIDIVHRLSTDYDFSFGVVNALVEYVMLITDMKLPKRFVETVAEQWQRKGIKNATEALQLARQEQDKKQQQFVPKVTTVTEKTGSHYDDLTPYEFLKQLNDNKEPFSFIVEQAERLVLQQGMPIGVVNVLMEFAMAKTNGTMSRKYIETIASNWLNLGIETTQQAKDYLVQDSQQLNYQPKVTAAHFTTQQVGAVYERYEFTTPYQFVKNYNNGAEPFSSMMQMIENLVLQYELSVGVVNVLVEHVLTEQQGQLPKRLVETIANTWRQQNITTAEQALQAIEQNEVRKKAQFTPKVTTAPTTQLDEEKPYAVTPYVFLKKMHKGKEPLIKDAQLAESLVVKFELPIMVANVLVEYVFGLKQQLPKRYVETIANTWRLQQIDTVSKAKEATQFSQQYQAQITEANVVDDKFVQYEGHTPQAFLQQLFKGKPLEKDIKMAETLVLKQEMPIGVVNVLMEYIFTIKEGVLNERYVETIATSWRAKEIHTTEQAVNEVTRANKAYEERQKRAQVKPWGKVEVVPDWLDKTYDTVTPPTQEEAIDFEQEREKIMALLNRKQ